MKLFSFLFCFLISVNFGLAQTPVAVSITNYTAASCNGICDGTATAAATGGSGTYTYSWNTSPVQTSATATGLCAGNYVCSVSDDLCSPSGTELVINGNFDAGNTGFSSTYNYTIPPNTTEAQYWVGTGAQVSTWNGGMVSSGDHTTGTGNLMLVNGSPIANSSIWCQSITVTANTSYLFSTWISSLYPTNPAQLQFSINGVLIGPIINAPPTTSTWTQFFASWNSGTSNVANICIVNQNTITAGNDFGLDDISFQACITSSAVTASATIPEPPVVALSAISPLTICAGGSATLSTIASGGNGGYNYIWSPAGTGNTASVTVSPVSTTTYTVNSTDADGCPSSAVTVTVTTSNSVINAAFTPSIDSGFVNLFVTFNNSSTGATSYLWDFGNDSTSTMANPSTTYTKPGTYKVMLITSNTSGCIDTAFSEIIVGIDYSLLWIPNVFTPNGDGLNDIFLVKGYNLKTFEGKIFNRWGELLFEWNDVSTGWNGKYKGHLVSDGVYVYIIRAKGADNTKYDKIGHLTVLQ